MIEVGEIREWRTHDVMHADGHKADTLDAIRLDTSTDEPTVATARTGLPTRHRLVFVPIDESRAPQMCADPPTAEQPAPQGRHAVILFLLIVIAAIVLGIVGVLAHGMLFLRAIGVLMLIADVAYLAVRSARNRRTLR